MAEVDFGQTRSFNLGVAKDTSIEAALVYDELAFWTSKSVNDGWVFKKYEEMMERLPLSKYQLREAYKLLQEKGYIEIKLKKAFNAPTLHFRLLKNLTMESKKTLLSMESKKTAHSITATTTNKHQYGKAVDKSVNKSVYKPDVRGQYSPAKEKLRQMFEQKRMGSQLTLTGG